MKKIEKYSGKIVNTSKEDPDFEYQSNFLVDYPKMDWNKIQHDVITKIIYHDLPKEDDPAISISEECVTLCRNRIVKSILFINELKDKDL